MSTVAFVKGGEYISDASGAPQGHITSEMIIAGMKQELQIPDRTLHILESDEGNEGELPADVHPGTLSHVLASLALEEKELSRIGDAMYDAEQQRLEALRNRD